MFELTLMIIGALVIYFIFYFTHGKYLEKSVFKADPARPTPAHKMYDGVDYVPANKYVLYGHHFASIAGAGPIVGPAIALGWGWLPTLLWVWFGNVFIGVVHDYLSLASSVRYDGRSIAWVSGRLMGKGAFYAFNTYIWFALLLVVAAFAYVISALFSIVEGAGVASILLIFFAIIVGLLMYRTRLGFKGGTVVGWILIIIAVWAGYLVETTHALALTMHQWMIILLIYTIVAASLPVWILLQPRDYMNAYILWASLAIGGAAAIVAGLKGFPVHFPAATNLLAARVVGGQPSPFWPTIPLVVACGALSGFHSLVGSGTTSKQLDKEVDALLIGYGGMLTEGFLATMVIASMAGFLSFALMDPKIIHIALVKAKGLIAKALGVSASAVTVATYKTFVHKLLTDPVFAGKFYAVFANKVKWAVIPYSYAYMTNKAFGFDVVAMYVFATLWITAFAMTSLDTGARIGRFAWQELMMPLKEVNETAYRILSNRWLASLILVGLGIALAWGGGFLIIWPAFAGMNQLLASLALMTISVWAIKVQRAPRLGQALTVAPAIFLWVTVTLALFWYLIVVVPAIAAAKPLTAAVVAAATCVGLGLNIYLFILWLLSLRRPAVEVAKEAVAQ